MKKIITISLLTVSLAVASVLGQGYFSLSSAKSQVYDGFTTPGVSALASTVNTAFLWGPSNTVPTVDSFLTSMPTTANSSTPQMVPLFQAWAAILNGQFNLATNATTGALVTQLSGANGSVIYNGSVSFPVTGTAPDTTYTVYMIGWDAHYATPALAAAANGGLGAALGWSLPFQFTAGQFYYALPNLIPFGNNFGTLPPVPEPATMALAALGGVSLLVFPRRNK
jgi:hypothetical protein